MVLFRGVCMVLIWGGVLFGGVSHGFIWGGVCGFTSHYVEII